jgi:hypothetical protein
MPAGWLHPFRKGTNQGLKHKDGKLGVTFLGQQGKRKGPKQRNREFLRCIDLFEDEDSNW